MASSTTSRPPTPATGSTAAHTPPRTSWAPRRNPSPRNTSNAANETNDPPPVRSRRNPRHIGLGVALIAVCGLGAGWLTTVGGAGHDVVITTTAIPAGTRIEAGQVRVAQVSGPGADAMGASSLEEVIGRKSSADLPAGTALNPGMLTPELALAGGVSMIGVPVKAGQLPASGLRPGDEVSVVASADTPAIKAAAAPTAGAAPGPAPGPGTIWTGTIASISPADAEGTMTVDVRMPTPQAQAAAAVSGGGKLVIILTRRNG